MTTYLANPKRVAMEVMARAIQPPGRVDFFEWACRNIVFSKRESQFEGPYNPGLFPYFTEILHAMGPDDQSREVTIKKSAQLGGTVLANIFVLGTHDMDPCDFLYVHPTEENGRRWSRMKLKPMLRSTPSVAVLFPERSRDGGDAVMFKERPDGLGSILITGANSPASLSQISIRRQVQDDLSKWEQNAAGDPEAQADSRSRAHSFAKVMKISTPLVSPGCKITDAFERGTQEHFQVPCPHCDHRHELTWENLRASLDKEKPEQVFFTCPECGGVIEEFHRSVMVKAGKWVAENPSARNRSFYIWSAYSPLQSWTQIADEWFKAEGKPESERVFLNDTVGMAYQFKGEAPPWETLRDRAQATGHQRGRIPAGALLLTAGIDVQKDRCEVQLVGWGREGRRWVIDYIIVGGHISEPATRVALNDLLEQKWKNEAGQLIGLDRVAVDGNAWTEDVWGWVKRIPAQKLIMMRGDNRDNCPLMVRVKREYNRSGKKLPWSRRFYNVGVSTLKMGLYRRLEKTDPMKFGYVGLAQGLEDEYFIQLTCERRVEERNRDGFTVARWKKDPNQANEALDTMNQAEAAAINLGVRELPESVWLKLEAERETAPPDMQLDFEDLPIAAAVVAQSAATNPTPGPSAGTAAAPKSISEMLA